MTSKRIMKFKHLALAFGLVLGALASAQAAGAKPNIVFMLTDNLGYGELGCYGGGILRGAPTPRIDRLASEGMRLLNFNVEAQCTPSRSALMTGRFSIRSGTYEVPIGGVPDGLTQWEVTIAELLSAQGYATGIWGKWHLGSAEARFPTHQGFDEWYGIPRTYDEAMWPSLNETKGMWPSIGNKQGWNAKVVHPEHIYEARKGEKARQIKVLDVENRRTMEAEITRRCVDFMRRRQSSASRSLPTFRSRWCTFPRFPTRSSPARPATATGPIVSPRWTTAPDRSWMPSRKRASKITLWSSSPATMDPKQYTLGKAGQVRGAAHISPRWKARLRVPFIIRWPGKVPVGGVSNEIVHIVDCFTTPSREWAERKSRGIARLTAWTSWIFSSANRRTRTAKASRPTSPIGCQPSNGATGRRISSGRRTCMTRPRYCRCLSSSTCSPTRRKSTTLGPRNSWVARPITKMLAEFEASLKKYPPIPMGTPDPYQPPGPKDR